MTQRISENIVICLDTSRSMCKTDIKPNRILCCVKALKEFIKARSEVDGKTSFAIVKFSDKAQKVIDFTNLTTDLYKALDSLTIGGASNIGDGLAVSIKAIINELRKIVANVPKILIVSDGKDSKSTVDPLKMGKLAKGINIEINSFKLGELTQLNILKRLSDLTGGTYYYANDFHSLVNSAQIIATSNIKISGAKEKKLVDNPAFLRKIAAKLYRVADLTHSQKERIKQIRGEMDFKKCSICFQDKDPATKGDFFLTGRYCPNCQTPYHIHCLSSWASSLSDGALLESGTCRCPHCFYLLKIPTEVTQVEKLRVLTGTSSIRQEGPKKPELIPATLENISNLGEQAIYNSCPVCNYIFEDNQEVVKCGNSECMTLYHLDCFEKLINEQCKVCGVKLHLY